MGNPCSTSSHDRARRAHLAELEKLLAGPIAEPALRERIRNEYIRLEEEADND